MAKSGRRPIVVGRDGNPVPPRRPWRIVIGVLLLFTLFVLAHDGAPLYCDWLWFREVGYGGVFTGTIAAKTVLYLVFALLFFGCFYGNLLVARRLSPEGAHHLLLDRFGPGLSRMLDRWLGWGMAGISLFLSLWAGRIAAENWSSWLELTHAQPFAVRDPVFGRDLSFYIFQLPFLHFLCGFLIGTLLFSLLAVILFHAANRAVETLSGLPQAPPAVRAQLLVLAAALALTGAFAAHLGTFDLLTADNGKFTGAGYTDLHFRLFALNAQVVLLLLTAAACLVPIWRGSGFRWPAFAAAGWLFALLVLGNLVPGIVQKTFVEPNEFSLEREYIRRNIEFTRRGFHLEQVARVDDFPADNSLTAAGIEANRATLDNVRLWDHPYLSKVYSQLQAVKNYYRFERESLNGQRTDNIDVDRYEIGGKLRQVMLGAREMDTSGLPESAQSWQNERLAYTHGFGVVMSPVNKTIGGLPDYFLSGIPVTGSPEAPNLKVTEPRIYYGQIEHSYVFVDTEQQEFDYPSTGGGASQGGQDHTTTYQGRGGIPIGSNPLAQWAFSFRLGDPNLLLTRSLTPRTRLLFRRDIRDRIQTIAPFIQQDGDPYLVVEPDSGRLTWIVDCYTLSDQMPYATPQRMDINSAGYIAPNYIRNSIKTTVDAYDGTVRFYISDAADPIVRTYDRIFPGLLQPMSAMPVGLRAHTRYPEDLFRLQRSVYAVYHVEDPRILYFREDSWAIPTEPNADQSAVKEGNAASQMEPYYVIMRLPEVTGAHGAVVSGTGEEFLLMSPLAPAKRESQNILGWMCARCDGAHYGELVLYRFPQQISVNGPSQVIAYVNNDPGISARLTPLRLGGSTATFGNLLVIPVDRSLLYVAPLYVESTSGATGLPKLQKVVAAIGDRVAMEDTLQAAIADLFPASGEAPPASAPSSGSPAVPQQIREVVGRLLSQYESARTRLKQGDLSGYAAAMKDVERTLDSLKRQTAPPAKP